MLLIVIEVTTNRQKSWTLFNYKKKPHVWYEHEIFRKFAHIEFAEWTNTFNTSESRSSNYHDFEFSLRNGTLAQIRYAKASKVLEVVLYVSVVSKQSCWRSGIYIGLLVARFHILAEQTNIFFSAKNSRIITWRK